MITNLENNEKSKENVTEHPQFKYIRCPECGEKILMVPTLGEMIATIEDHLTSHKKHPHDDLTVVHLRKPAIELDLAQQALLQASDLTNLPQKPPVWL